MLLKFGLKNPLRNHKLVRNYASNGTEEDNIDLHLFVGNCGKCTKDVYQPSIPKLVKQWKTNNF